jgi:hypothetical protein
VSVRYARTASLNLPMNTSLHGRIITFTPYGEQHAKRAVDRINWLCLDVATICSYKYMSTTEKTGVPGNYHIIRGVGGVKGGFRDPFRGHPTEADRPHLGDVLQSPQMAEVIQQGCISRARYGNLQILNSMLPMYYRMSKAGPEVEKVVQKGPPIWAIVEYGVGEHSITPRADRTWMRFRWGKKHGEYTYAKRVSHPGAFRTGGVGWFSAMGGSGGLSTFGSVGSRGTLSRTAAGHFGRRLKLMGNVGADEPFGIAPFRRAQFAMQQTAASVLDATLRARRPL